MDFQTKSLITPHIGSLQDFYGILYDSCGVSKYSSDIFLLDNIITFWNDNKDFWFCGEEVIYFPIKCTMYTSCKNIDMSLLLHYDQIFRHPSKYICPEHRPVSYRFATQIALRIIHSDYYDTMTTWEKVFTLLAIRHNHSLKMKYLSLKKTYALLLEDPTNALLLRFLKASILNINKVKLQQGIACFDYDNPEYTDECSTKYMYTDDFVDIIENQSSFEEDVVCIDDKMKYAFHAEFLDTLDLFKSTTGSYPKKLAISISGGVDSMVASYCLNTICKKLDIELILLHICYNNRDCCEKEIKFMQYWSVQLQRPLYVRKIDEITRVRHSKMRTMYEEVTRNIRFSFYKHFGCPIILGHNKDDCFENAFSNLSKSIHFENLFGMKPVSMESDVFILRPMLSIEKKDIVTFAKKCCIPYLEDSTPAWSQRGKMRDGLIRYMDDFNPTILKGLGRFIKHTSFLQRQWKKSLESWFKTNVFKFGNNLNITKDDFFYENFEMLDFWIQLWFHHKMKTRPSNKSFEHLMNNIKMNKMRSSDLNKYYKVTITDESIGITYK